MTTRLRKLRIDRVDFVDTGANPGAFITLAKRHNEEKPMAEMPEEVVKRLADAEEAVKALQKRAEDAEARALETVEFQKAAEAKLAEEIAKRETAECETIAQGLVLPGIADKAAFIKGLRQSPMAGAVIEVLKALAVADRTSEVFKELGSDHPAGPAREPDARLNEMAEALVKSGSVKNRAEGLKAVLDTPEGKAEYQKYVATKTRKGV